MAQPHQIVQIARQRIRGLVTSAIVFSIAVNLLMLTAPIYMLQIYDRVLSNRSFATLASLTLLMSFLFVAMGCLDYARSRVLTRAGARLRTTLDGAAFRYDLQGASPRAPDRDMVKNVNAIQHLFKSPALCAVFDLPWTPFFLILITMLHPLLGVLAVVGGGLLVGATLINQWLTKSWSTNVRDWDTQADTLFSQTTAASRMVSALGLSTPMQRRWQDRRQHGLRSRLRLSDRHNMFAVFSKTFRQFLQSAMLGLGAYLALLGELSPGGMIAGSILLARALAPVDHLIGQWPTVQQAFRAWRVLVNASELSPPVRRLTQLPPPNGKLLVEDLTYIPEGSSFTTLRNISFSVHPGEVLGVIGATGAGKTTLALLLTGAEVPTSGAIRLGGVNLHHHDPETRNCSIGYLPQHVTLFSGTIAENIAGFSTPVDDDKVIAAAIAAGAHELILSLPDGYDTKIAPLTRALSGGQAQRICLARALFGTPALVIMDEPDLNLDHAGSLALNTVIRGIKDRGGTVVLIAHRPAVLQNCDRIMSLHRGNITDLGPRSEVLKRSVQNTQHLYALPRTNGGRHERA